MLRMLAAIVIAMIAPTLTLGQTTAPIWATSQAGAKLIQIDTKTGAATVVGLTGYAGTAPLAFHPDGTLYTFTQVMSADPSVPEQLAVLNPATGQATLIGSPLAERTRIMPLIVSPDGTLYAAGIMGSSANKLLKIDRATGQASEVGPFGVSGMMDLTYRSDGVLFGASQTALFRIDTETGNTTLVATFGGDLIVSGSSRVMGISYAPDGTLYATDFVSTALGNSSLYIVDPATGTGTRVGNTGAAQVHSADMQPPSALERVSALAIRTSSYGFSFGIQRSLTAKLDNAAVMISQGTPLAACDALMSFKNEVRALTENKLTNGQAAQLQLDATWTETSLDCPQ